MPTLRPRARPPISPPRQDERRAHYYPAGGEFGTDAAAAMEARMAAWRRERRFRRLARLAVILLLALFIFMAGISVGVQRAGAAGVNPQLHYPQRAQRLVAGTLACEQDVHEGCLICYHRFAAGQLLVASHC